MLEEYLRQLTERPEEVEYLAERLTIKVSRFYRNAPIFDVLRHETLPRVMREHGRVPLRIWVAGRVRRGAVHAGDAPGGRRV